MHCIGSRGNEEHSRPSPRAHEGSPVHLGARNSPWARMHGSGDDRQDSHNNAQPGRNSQCLRTTSCSEKLARMIIGNWNVVARWAPSATRREGGKDAGTKRIVSRPGGRWVVENDRTDATQALETHWELFGGMKKHQDFAPCFTTMVLRQWGSSGWLGA